MKMCSLKFATNHLSLPLDLDWQLSVDDDFDASIVFHIPRPPQNPICRLCFSPHLEVSKMALNTLNSQSQPGSEACSILRKLKVPLLSPASSSELVPFAGRMRTTVAAHLSTVKSLFTKSSPSDPTVSAISSTLPDESQHLTGTAILIDNNCVPLVKSTIIACLDLLEQPKASFDSIDTDFHMLTEVLDWSWFCTGTCLFEGNEPLLPVIESAFSDVPQLCALLERTCCLSSPNFQHLRLIINITAYLPTFVAPMLEENLVQRILDTSKPMVVPTANGDFHITLIWVIVNLAYHPGDFTKDKEEQKRIRKLQFERVLRPAKQYLLFILQREEFIPKTDKVKLNYSTLVASLLEQTYHLERDLLEDGEIVQTGREEWEVGWLVELTDENCLTPGLETIREDDETTRRDEKERWKKRVSRQREAGHEDAMEGWLMRRDENTRSEIVEYLKRVSVESGMNNSLWEEWRENRDVGYFIYHVAI
ncbi:hypothetical protein BLNAU_4861 [Blattamonas nauphoetae]|uniref:Uncharacterized protein n=1 Tax=Blattamonas nauphoetae TaxID=2049346 RepID=A0ABQ9Y9D7_9EUKA|nr:hypothetical protein BLNAU_4861 [Blattamonas nauphoetae]